MNIEQGLRIENENLKRLLEETERERDEALAYGERLRGVIVDATNNGAQLDDGCWVYSIDDSVLSEQPPAALAALKAELQAVGAMAAWVDLKRMGMAQSGSKSVIQSLVLKLRQRAQEAGNGS